MRVLLLCLTVLVLVAALQARGDVLPPDDEYRLSLLVHDDWEDNAQEARLVSWFQSHPKLKQLRCDLYRSGDPMFESQFGRAIAELPCVLLQRIDGYVLEKLSGSNISSTSDELCSRLFRHRPIYLLPWRRPKPAPSPPAPSPKPDVLPDKRDVLEVAVPDTSDGAEATFCLEGEAGFPWALAALAIGISAIGTGIVQLKKRIESFE